MPPRVSGPLIVAIKLSKGPWWKNCHLQIHANTPLKQTLWATCWVLLEIEAFTEPEPVVLYTQLPMMFWAKETAPHKLIVAVNASIIQRAQLWPPCLPSLARDHDAGWCNPFPVRFGYLRNLLELTKWTAVGVHRLLEWWSSLECSCSLSLSKDVSDKGWDLRVSTIGHISGDYLSMVPCWHVLNVAGPLPKSCPLLGKELWKISQLIDTKI
jgi:hypothetical protein